MDIVYLPSAKIDVNQIISYIAIKLDSKTSARNLLAEFDKSISTLADYPRSGKVYSHGLDFRFILVKNYAAFYKITEIEIVIHRVIYVKRNFEDLL